MGRTFYDLGKAGYWGPQTKGKVDVHFDESRTLAPAQVADWEAAADRARKHRERQEAVRGQMKERAQTRREGVVLPEGAKVMACGGGTEQMREPAE